jgi:Fic-DOC domain mobile mystery protein B
MFGDVWKWAGTYRTSDTNIGIDWPQIPESVANLCEDARLWCSAAESAPARDTAAIEFHHRLVLIHPFVNGNGRHARLTADLLIAAMGSEQFSWGQTAEPMPTTQHDPVRGAYLDALRRADRGDLSPLIAFARS